MAAVEGCRRQERSWPGARVCCWDFKAVMAVMCNMPAIMCVCVCECVGGFSPGKPLQQV